jgi:hypothetical protein
MPAELGDEGEPIHGLLTRVMENVDLDEAQKEFTSHIARRSPLRILIESIPTFEFHVGEEYTSTRYRVPIIRRRARAIADTL